MHVIDSRVYIVNNYTRVITMNNIDKLERICEAAAKYVKFHELAKRYDESDEFHFKLRRAYIRLRAALETYEEHK